MTIDSEGRVFRPSMVGREKKAEPPKETDLHNAATDLLKVAKDNIQAIGAGRMAGAMLSESRGEGGGSSEITQQMMAMFSGLTSTLMGMVELERGARQEAEKSNTQAMRDYWTFIAEQAKDVQTRFQGVQPPAPQTLTEKITEMQTITDMVNNNASRIAKEVLSTTQPATSRSGFTPVDVDLKKLEVTQATTLESMKQSHDVAMKNLDIQIARLNLEAAQWKAQQVNKQSWFEDILGNFGKAFVQGSAQGQADQAAVGGSADVPRQHEEAPPTQAAPVRTPANLIPVECTSCATKFAVVPGMTAVACPSCGTEHDVSNL